MRVEILPRCWMTDSTDVAGIVKQRPIRCLFNLSVDIDFPTDLAPGIEKVRVPIKDRENSDYVAQNRSLLNAMDQIVETLHHYLTSGQTVVIYSRHGLQRPPALLAGYLMRYGHVSNEKAVDYIQTKAPDVFQPASEFQIALRQYETKVKKYW